MSATPPFPKRVPRVPLPPQFAEWAAAEKAAQIANARGLLDAAQHTFNHSPCGSPEEAQALKDRRFWREELAKLEAQEVKSGEAV